MSAHIPLFSKQELPLRVKFLFLKRLEEKLPFLQEAFHQRKWHVLKAAFQKSALHAKRYGFARLEEHSKKLVDALEHLGESWPSEAMLLDLQKKLEDFFEALLLEKNHCAKKWHTSSLTSLQKTSPSHSKKLF